jgi:hypothetical protein
MRGNMYCEYLPSSGSGLGEMKENTPLAIFRDLLPSAASSSISPVSTIRRLSSQHDWYRGASDSGRNSPEGRKLILLMISVTHSFRGSYPSSSG